MVIFSTPEPKKQTYRLTILYILALSSIALLTIVGQAVVFTFLKQQFSDANVVNIAGRQRMLSQRLSKAALIIQISSDEITRQKAMKELAEVRALWQQSHQALQQGDSDLNVPGDNSPIVTAMFAGIEQQHQAMLEASQNLLEAAAVSPEADISLYVDQILQAEPAFLTGMDGIVFQYAREATARVNRLELVERGLLIVTILVLLFEGLFIFRPAVNKIHQVIDELVQTRQELYQAKELAESADRSKTIFLANMSHEIRTPLNAVIGIADLLGHTPLNRDQHYFTETIRKSSEDLLAIINSILDFSKIEAGKTELEEKSFELRECVEAALSFLAFKAAEKEIELRCNFDPQLPKVISGDPVRLRRILVNLLSNAVKFTEQGEILVTASGQPEPERRYRLYFSVKDTGIGIPPEKVGRLFKPFSQVDSSITRKYGGTGLGLAICQRLTSLMGGSLSVTSSGIPGQGSTFQFDILVNIETAAPQPAPRPQPELPVAQGRLLRILLAEDNLTNQQVALMLLENLGYRADVAHNGQGVLEALAQNSYDLILMDLQMPGLDGLETTRRILQRFAPGHRPKIIALTANALIGDREKCLAAGMDDYLSKPIRLESLGQLLARYQPASTLGSSRPKPALDLSLLLEAANGDEQALQEVIKVILKSLPEKLANLKAGIASRNARQVENAAHLLKSDSAFFNRSRLNELCALLERAGCARQFQEAAELFRQVEAEWQPVQEALRAAQYGP